jgi:hypothetical protein
MNIGRSEVKERAIEVGQAVSFDRFSYGERIPFDGLVREVNDRSCLIKYWDEGQLKEIQVPIRSVRLSEWVVGDWWKNILDAERVLGDKEYIDEVAPLKIDAIGRGKKGFGHGSIDMKPVRRKRKSGRIWESKQAWYQWEDESGKHCRYLRKGQDLTVQRLLDEGATVEMILESIGKSKESSKGKTR